MLVIRGAEVLPGDGPAFRADVGIEHGVIAAVGDRLEGETLDATGMLLCPGFIDLHAHSALASFHDPLLDAEAAAGIHDRGDLPRRPCARAGRAMPDARRAYLRALEGDGPSELAVDDVRRVPRRARRDAARDVARARRSATASFASRARRRRRHRPEQLRDAPRGAPRHSRRARARSRSGSSTFPGRLAATDELVAVAEDAGGVRRAARPARPQRGRWRPRGGREMIDVARRSGAPLHLSHLKSLADERPDRAAARADRRGERDLTHVRPVPVRRRLDAARARCCRSGRRQAAPRRRSRGRATPSQRGGIAHDVARRAARLGEPARHARPRAHLRRRRRSLAELAGGDARRQQCSTCCSRPSSRRRWSCTTRPTRRCGRSRAIRVQLVGSDGIFGEHPHPRLYGDGARASSAASRSASGCSRWPRRRRAADRARRRPPGPARPRPHRRGMRADLVLLDPELYVDEATYEDPKRSPDGVLGVWVAGEAVVTGGRTTGARPGGVLRS